jgi:hypothetical protein
MRSVEEVERNAASVERGPLDAGLLDALRAASLGDHPLLNPGAWQGRI